MKLDDKVPNIKGFLFLEALTQYFQKSFCEKKNQKTVSMTYEI